ncbi:MAG: carbohydrate-binding domain-containing protein [Clostridia bacterium]|nr:carbohydrate-binding domain-containing protein [Clostridia bacterium]
MKKIWIGILILVMIASSVIGCSSASNIENTSVAVATSTDDVVKNTSNDATASSVSTVVSDEVAAIEEVEATLTNTSDAIAQTIITLKGTSASVSGSGVSVKEGLVLISAPGVYDLTGSFDGQIQVETDLEGTVQLILNNVSLENSESAPIYVVNAERTIITLKENTVNTIVDNSAYTKDDGTDQERINGAIYSKDDLVLNGLGKLTVKAINKTAILGKDEVIIESGEYELSGGVNGIKGKDLVYIFNGTIEIASGTDGIESEVMVYIAGGNITIVTKQDGLKSDETIYVLDGTIEITAEDDGIHGDVLVQFNGGNVTILDSYEGIESKDIVINDGLIYVNASDDGVNATDGSGEAFGHPQMEMGGTYDWGLHINGGQLTLNSYGDGLDSNGSVWMTGGIVIVSGPIDNGNGSLDYNGTFEMTGGYLVASGSSGMFQDQGSTSSINSIAIGFDTSISEGTTIEILDSEGNSLLTYVPAKSFTSVLFATPDLINGETFQVLVNDETYATVLISEVVNTVGNISSDMMGGKPGDRQGGFH